MTRRGYLDWDDLRVFLEVARHGHLSPAARRLKVDLATVSRRLTRLEQALDARLFERTRTGLSLGDAGRQLLGHAELIESQIIAAQEGAEGSTGRRGVVRIATMEGIGSFYLAPNFNRFISEHPDIEVNLVTLPQSVNLTRREADVFISFFKPEGRALIPRKTGEFSLGLYASPAYLKRFGKPKSVDDLANHFFVDYIDDLVAIDAVRWLSDVIKNPKVVFHSTSVIAQKHVAVSGAALALLPSFVAARDERLRLILAEEVSVKREIWLSVHHDLCEVPRIKAITQFIADLVEKDRDFLTGRYGKS